MKTDFKEVFRNAFIKKVKNEANRRETVGGKMKPAPSPKTSDRLGNNIDLFV